MRVTVIDAFCGIGGFTEGLKQAGFEVVYAFDINPEAIRIYKANHPDVEAEVADIRHIREVPEADVVVGGPPCQEFSVARRGRGKKRYWDLELICHFFRVVGLAGARYYLMENVPPVRAFFRENGRILDFSDYGLPQQRRRFILTNFPLPKKSRSRAIRDIIPGASGMLDVTNRSQSRSCLITGDSPSFTVTGKGYDLLILEEDRDDAYFRKLTVREALLLQGFPEDYVFPNIPQNRAFQLIGNAFPPIVAKRFGEALLESLNGKTLFVEG